MSDEDTTPRDGLLLQATPTLLDGWCGPVVWDGCPGLIAPTGRLFATEKDDPYGYYDSAFPSITDIYLDLAHEECRDRVARVVARVTWFEEADLVMATAPRWFCHWMHDGPFWSLSAESIREGHKGARSGSCVSHEHTPDGLDPSDDTRLPDGSRLVDALGLLSLARAVLDAS